jgi:hypothetical protein
MVFFSTMLLRGSGLTGLRGSGLTGLRGHPPSQHLAEMSFIFLFAQE